MSSEATNKSKRLASLDALRGFDMFFIMGFAGLLVGCCNLLPKCGITEWISTQMTHVDWNGLRHHDTIFPLFLFIAGISFPFSLAKQRSLGHSNFRIYCKIVYRGLMLVFLGLICSGLLKFEFSHLRYCSVLGRIGLAWMFAALLFVSIRNVRVLAIIAAFILIAYWLMMWLIPNCPDPYSLENNLVGKIDRAILGPQHLYYKEMFDPEGLFSTLPAIVTAMLGMFTGMLVRLPEKTLSGNRKTIYMLAAAVGFILIAWIWNYQFPINKKLWSSSFVCALAGYSLIMFAIFYYIIDVKGWSRWAFFFQVIGMNSITIFMLPRFINVSWTTHSIFDGAIGLFPEAYSGVLFSTCYLLVAWSILYFFYRKKVFLKV